MRSALLAATLAALDFNPAAAAKVALPAEYLARLGDSADGCNFFVHFEEGNDSEEGSDIDYPLKTLECATDPNCNNGLDVSSLPCAPVRHLRPTPPPPTCAGECRTQSDEVNRVVSKLKHTRCEFVIPSNKCLCAVPSQLAARWAAPHCRIPTRRFRRRPA